MGCSHNYILGKWCIFMITMKVELLWISRKESLILNKKIVKLSFGFTLYIKHHPKVALFLILATVLNQVTSITIMHDRELVTGDRFTFYIIWSLLYLYSISQKARYCLIFIHPAQHKKSAKTPLPTLNSGNFQANCLWVNSTHIKSFYTRASPHSNNIKILKTLR